MGARRSVSLSADARRRRSALFSEGDAPAPVASVLGAHPLHDRRHRGTRVRRVGAERQARERGRRFLPLGRAPASHAAARQRRASSRSSCPTSGPDAFYKYEIMTRDGTLRLKTDPFAPAWRGRPAPPRASRPRTTWGDEAWMRSAPERDWAREPMTIYEVHLGSWARVPEEGDRSLTYREIAPRLVDHCRALGFTHVELMPVAEQPFEGSWGYQVTGYYAPDLALRHARRLPLSSSTPATSAASGSCSTGCRRTFPRDDFALRRFDGTALYEHEDPRRGEHPGLGHAHLQLRTARGTQLPDRQRAVLAEGVPRRRPARRRRRVDALPRLQPHGRRVDAEPLRRAREHGGDRVPARLQLDHRPRRPGSVHHRRGVHRLAGRHARRCTTAGSASRSSGTWAGCTTRCCTSRRSPFTAASTTTSSPSR